MAQTAADGGHRRASLTKVGEEGERSRKEGYGGTEAWRLEGRERRNGQDGNGAR